MSSADFSKLTFQNILSVSNSLIPDQDRRHVSPDLGPNCLQRLPADNKSRPLSMERVKQKQEVFFV